MRGEFSRYNDSHIKRYVILVKIDVKTHLNWHGFSFETRYIKTK
jgi:hypothetical protein